MGSIKKAYAIAAYKKTHFYLIAIMRTICNLMMIGNALIFGELINMVARGEQITEIAIAVCLTALYCIVWCVFRWITYLKMQKYVVKVTESYREKYLRALLGAKYSEISNQDSSVYLNSINDDIDKIVQTAVFNCSDFLGCIISVVASFCAALVLRWEIALTMVGFTLIMAILPFFIKKRLESSMIEKSKRKAEYIGALKENLLGLSIIKSYGGEERCEKRIKYKDHEYVKAQNRYIVINTVAGELSNTIRQFALVVLIAATCYFVYIKKVEVGAVLSVFSIGNSFYGYIMYASAIFTSLFSIGALIDKTNKIVNIRIDNSTNNVGYEQAISLKDVCFSYTTDNRSRVLNGVSVDFERNRKYLILGESGSGKSTVIKLISKLYDNYDGEITIDGINYKNFNEKEISKIISLSQQDGYLFNRTLRDNIDFLGEGDEQKLINTINVCMLNDFVNCLPNGLDTVLDEEVNQVSGGEKLRINLARALYKNSKILLLDEVTSALDKKTSDIVERNILNINDRTVINVCHKFNDKTLNLYDQIIIIEKGKIVLKGNYEELHYDEKLAKYRNTDN